MNKRIEVEHTSTVARHVSFRITTVDDKLTIDV